MEQRWWTSPAEAENGKTIIVTGRDDVDKYRLSGDYRFRVNVSWRYNSLPDGFPEEGDAVLMENVTEVLHKTLKKNKAVVMTGIYTGDGCRDWVFYTKNLNIFQSVFNRALAEMETIPFEIEAEEDCGWEEYMEMREGSYIPLEE